MSATHETPVAVSETVPSSGLDTTTPAPTSTVEPTTEAAPTSVADADVPATDAPADPPSALVDPAKDDAVKIEAVPITSGNLGFKTGPLKLFKFSQRYFWLGDEAPLEESTIAHFHKGNHENKHHTAAHASQTGKGLLLYAKRAEDKTQPEGIFNLAEVTDVVKDGALEFFFKIHDKKQSFQATKTAERDGWLVAINNAVNEALASKESLRETDGYKDSYKKYFGAGAALTAGAAGAAGTAGVAATKESKTEDKTQEGAAVPAAEGPTTKKDGSRSRSRGPLGLFKQTKEKTVAGIENAKEKAEIKKEEKKEEKAEAKKEEEAAAVGTGAATIVTEPETKTPTQKKRQSSIFGSIFKKNEDKSATPAKEIEPVASEAPKIDTVAETGAPLTETVPTETTAETTAATADPAIDATPAVADTTTAPTPAVVGKKERSRSPKGKGFGGLFSRSDKKTTKTEEATPVAATTAEPAIPADNVTTDTTPVVDSVTPATETTATETSPVETTTPAVETKPTGTTKAQDKRRSSLQAFLGFGKNKDAATSKEPEVSADGKENFADLPKKEKLSIFRSSSKKVKDTTPATTAPPVPAKDTEPIAESAPATETIVPIVETADGEATVIGRPSGTAAPTFGQPVKT